MIRPSAGTEAPWDLVVMAPSRDQSRSTSWIEHSARTAAGGIAPDGLVYVVAGAATRWRIGRALRRAGLVITARTLHRQTVPEWLLIIRMDREAVRATLDRLLPRDARRRTVQLAASPVGIGLASLVHPDSALIARRPGAPTLGRWLTTGDSGAPGQIAAIRARRSTVRDRALIYLLSSGGKPAIAKLCLRGGEESTRIREEARNLRELGSTARAAGAAIPSGEILETHSGCPVLIQEVLQGEPATAVLGADPEALEPLLHRIGDWLERWGQETLVTRPASPFLQAAVLEPAIRLSTVLEDGAAYANWLEARCRELENEVAPLVATHGDLTMSNLLVARASPLGVVDWEAATTQGMPLGDFYYAMADATAARGRYRDREGAYDQCFQAGGAIAGLVRRLRSRLQRSLGVSDDLATMAFHACWLHHAENERRKRAPGEHTPFLSYLRRAARSRHAIASAS